MYAVFDACHFCIVLCTSPPRSVGCTQNPALTCRTCTLDHCQAKEEKEREAEEEIEKEEKEQIRMVGEKLLARLVGRALGRVSDEAFATECRDWADHLCRAPGGLDLVKMSRFDENTIIHKISFPFCYHGNDTIMVLQE